MILFALSLFFTEPAPIDMPRAEAYLVRENGMSFLEDRYLRIDLWGSQAMLGRWIDADGRVFGLAQFGVSPPMAGFCESVTRVKFEEEKRPMPRVPLRPQLAERTYRYRGEAARTSAAAAWLQVRLLLAASYQLQRHRLHVPARANKRLVLGPLVAGAGR